MTVNQHRTFENPNCDQTSADPWNWGSCSNTAALPFPAIAQDSTPVEAFSYHVNAFGGTQPKKGRFCQAVCDYQFAQRPKIISSDFGPAKTAHVSQWLEVVCDDATRSGGAFQGRLHFEHWENDLSNAAKDGQCLSGYNTWGDEPDGGKEIIDLFDDPDRDCASVLAPNGLIYRPVDTNRLRWSTSMGKEENVTLVGFGHMGAVAMGNRLTLPNYLRDMRWKRANLTRVWAVEQWVAQAPEDNCSSGSVPGLTPFPGTLGSHNYNLQGESSSFYEYLRRFVQSGADHGIVVQLSVFDKHGLLKKDDCPRGHFNQSPYNADHNTDMQNRFPSPLDCTCSAGFDSDRVEEDPLLACDPPPDFVASTSNTDFHFPYLSRVARETGATGNVMYEIINEAMPENWTGGEQWQIEMARFLKRNLPVSVVRDAFNEYTTGSLAGKSPDARQSGNDTWIATNAIVSYTNETNTNLKMGKVVPMTTGPMWGNLPFAQPALWTDLGIRATVTAASTGAKVGVGTSAGHHVRLDVIGPQNKLRVVKVGYGGLAETVLGEVPLTGAAAENTIRLRIVKDGQGNLFTEVIVNGLIISGLSLPVGDIEGAFSTAFFETTNPLGAPPSVDNFEAAYFCDSPSLCGGGSIDE